MRWPWPLLAVALLLALTIAVACTGNDPVPATETDASARSATARAPTPEASARPTASATDAAGPPTPAADEPTPTGRLAFAAGGSIYIVNADGSALREVVAVQREPESDWNAAPSLSPDGSQLLFTRDFDIWTATGAGQDVRLLADVGEWKPASGASNFSVGAQSVAWSPDREHALYVLARIGGSGVNRVWAMRSDGSDRELIHRTGGGFLLPNWLDDRRIALYEGGGLVRVIELNGQFAAEVQLIDVEGFPLTVSRTADGKWLAGRFTGHGPIFYGPPDALSVVATGVSPTLSPDGRWIAYLLGDSLRVDAVDGSANYEVVNLARLGGRDRHFASGCRGDACSYRAPVISWIDPGAAFSLVGEMREARVSHTATRLQDGSVLIAGGTGDVGPLRSAELYRPDSETFAPTGRMVVSRSTHTATLLDDGRVLIVGGASSTRAELYDPATGAFSDAGNTLAPRRLHSAVRLADGRVLVVGGADFVEPTAEIYDPATGAFAATGELVQSPRQHLTVTLLNDGRVLITGGCCDSNFAPWTTAELFDPATNEFTLLDALSLASSVHAAVLLDDGRVWVSTGNLFDPGSETFSRVPAPDVGRTPATKLADGRVLIAGGFVDYSVGTIDAATIFDPATLALTDAGELATPRQSHTATLLEDGSVLLAGGSVGVTSPTPLASAERYVP